MNLIAYVIIGTLIIFIFVALFNMRINNSIALADESLHSVSMAIDSVAKTAVDHTTILRNEAQQNLSEQPGLGPNKLFSSLTNDTQGEKYGLYNLPSNYNKDLASYILGGGKIPDYSSETAQEIEASLKLNLLFSDIKHNIPQAAWIYYYSSNRFINMYPFENQADTFTWSDAYLTHPLFLSAQPQQNPTRGIKWFEAYIDEAGKGLMTSIVAPVYDGKDRFRGMVGMDFTLETMKNYLVGTGLNIGTPFLVNQQGQVLAHPNAIKSDDKTVKQLNEVLPSELKDVSEKILKIKAGQYYDISGWKIYALDINNTPWRLLFIVDQKKLIVNTIREMWVELIGILLILFVIGVFEQRQRIAQKLRIYKAAVESSSAAIIITDCHGRILHINKSFVEITGYSEADVIGSETSILKAEQESDEAYGDLRNAFNSNENWHGEMLNKKKDGTLYWVNISISPVARNKDDSYYVAIMEDITERKHMLKALNKLATIDALTNIPNRTYFISIAEREFQRAIEYDISLSVIMMDIDHFKQVNDTYGHAVGDLALQQFASKCIELVGKNDCVGRLGGEEFAILLPETDLEDAVKTGERIRRAVELLEVVTDDGQRVNFTCSMGVAHKKKEDYSFSLLLSRADIALYKAKNSGRNKVMVES
jgi:PAS domain S-box/diguanylate cyclase (GGDEF) domain